MSVDVVTIPFNRTNNWALKLEVTDHTDTNSFTYNVDYSHCKINNQLDSPLRPCLNKFFVPFAGGYAYSNFKFTFSGSEGGEYIVFKRPIVKPLIKLDDYPDACGAVIPKSSREFLPVFASDTTKFERDDFYYADTACLNFGNYEVSNPPSDFAIAVDTSDSSFKLDVTVGSTLDVATSFNFVASWTSDQA
jgi:hypothetical protein